MIDCLEYAVSKDNEIPRIIEIIFNKISGNIPNNIETFNKKMRTAKEIMRDYGLEV